MREDTGNVPHTPPPLPPPKTHNTNTNVLLLLLLLLLLNLGAAGLGDLIIHFGEGLEAVRQLPSEGVVAGMVEHFPEFLPGHVCKKVGGCGWVGGWVGGQMNKMHTHSNKRLGKEENLQESAYIIW